MNKPAPDSDETNGISNRYRYYVLGVLLVVYVINFLDRQVLSILLEPIKDEMHLSDTQLGLLGGIAFAIFYAFFGIPLARLADRVSRRDLLAVCLIFWSVMTAATGRAQNFTMLLVTRIGVGIGESGASPSSHSMISDLFPEEKRATALSIYALGIPLGTLLGFALGGWLAAEFGWRIAFIVAGVPGIIMALVMFATVTEPKRGLTSPGASTEPIPFKKALKYLLSRKSFVHLGIAGGLCSFTGYGAAVWVPSLLTRVHGVELDDRGYIMAFLAGAIGAIGTFGGGWLADKVVARTGDTRWYVWIPALGQLANLPAILLAYTVGSVWLLILFAIPAYIAGSLWLGPTFALTQNMVTPAVRAFASSILLFFINIIGGGLGPFVIGYISNLFQSQFGEAEAIRYSLFSVTVVVTLWGIVHFWLAGKYLKEDLAQTLSADTEAAQHLA